MAVHNSTAGHRAGGGRPRTGWATGLLAASRGRTFWLPIAAAVVVAALLMWYSLAASPAPAPGGNLGTALGGARTGVSATGSNLGSASAARSGGGSSGGAVAAVNAGSAGCEAGKSLAAGTTTQTVTVGGMARSYLLTVPATAPNAAPLPMIIDFHDAGQAPTDLEAATGMAGTASGRGYAVVDPVGVAGRWNFVRSATAGPDDVAFVAAMLADLRTRGCFADGEVFATGLGDGADMAVAASCALPGRIAAVISVAGSTVPAACANTITNLFEIHGDADPIAPWAGGGPPRAAPLAGMTAQPVTDRLGRYAQDAGCAAAPTTEALPGLGQLVAWTCEGRPDVGALQVTGGGHTWPQAQPRPTDGPTATSFSATVVSLLYFQAHPVVGSVVSPTTPSLAQALGGALGGSTTGG
jgi:polyhydroxybutyrate depolymerase